MIVDELIAAEGRRLRPCRRATRNEVGCLVVAETREGGVLARKVVVEANVPGTFVELSGELIGVIEAAGARRIGRGVERNYFRADWVDHRGRDDIAGDSCRGLRSVGIDGGRNQSTAYTVALQRGKREGIVDKASRR